MATPALAVVTALVLLVLLTIAIRRPPLAAALLVLLVPLTTGLARGGSIPLLKPSEAVVGIVACGALLNRLPARSGQQLSWLDLVVAAFGAVGIAVPVLVLLLTRTDTDLNTWRTVLSPVQFVIVYLLFSRIRFNDGELELVLRMSLLGGSVVGAVALAQLIDVPGVRALLDSYYPSPAQPAWDTTYRPDSLVGHYSAVGGLCLLSGLLALGLAVSRHPRFSDRFLAVTMLASVLGVIASETFAPFLVLVPAGVVLCALRRRVPREAAATLVALVVGLVALWPNVSGRVASQGLLSGGAFSPSLPESIAVRVRYWQEFMIPALRDHLWIGTGTVVPSIVPLPLTAYVDNEYLWAGFRAGVLGIAAVVLLLGVTGMAGIAQWRSPDPWRRAIGPVAGVSALAIALVGMTSEYITFGGVAQSFAMLVGLLAGLTATPVQATGGLVVAPRRGPRGRRLAGASAISRWRPSTRWSRA